MSLPGNEPERGQALVELVLSMGFLLGALAAGTLVIRAEWQRTQCAHAAFEAAHAALRGERPPKWGARIRILAERETVLGEARCGSIVETIRLKRLETVDF